jgi:CubicO group peptidase (beta-lactamase class C family)
LQFSLLAFSLPAAAQMSDAQIAERVDAVAAKALSRPIAGLSVAISRDGKVIFAKGYGMANLDHSVHVTPYTVFHICSISKNIPVRRNSAVSRPGQA